MSTNEERNTHFQGFAKLLYPELFRLFANQWRIGATKDQIRQAEQEIKTLLALRGYDLAQHVRDDIYSRSYELDFPSLKDVPDLTEWPKSENNGR